MILFALQRLMLNPNYISFAAQPLLATWFLTSDSFSLLSNEKRKTVGARSTAAPVGMEVAGAPMGRASAEAAWERLL
jgi:hypothetical protein